MLKDIHNIVILSGGSGNDAVLEALIKYGDYSDKNINIIVNAYDDGKSTGVCREVTNTLGVSDIRKNHEKLYRMLKKDKANKSILDLYTKRVSIDKNYKTGITFFDTQIKKFFERPQSELFTFDNFNVMNIVYSQLYSDIGYEKTNELVSKNYLAIQNIVHLNSFDNMKIVANTKNGIIITDEEKIVDWNNPFCKITDIDFVGKETVGLNQKAINLIDKADLIIISSGTFWSSIYPTLVYKDFYKYINESRARKLWIMNSKEDKDAIGVSSKEFCSYMDYIGLDILNMGILINEDAVDILKENIGFFEKESVIRNHLGNIEGRHDSKLLYKALKDIYGEV